MLRGSRVCRACRQLVTRNWSQWNLVFKAPEEETELAFTKQRSFSGLSLNAVRKFYRKRRNLLFLRECACSKVIPYLLDSLRGDSVIANGSRCVFWKDLRWQSSVSSYCGYCRPIKIKKTHRFSEEVILELILKNVYKSLLLDWRCVLCLQEYCSLLILQLIMS